MLIAARLFQSAADARASWRIRGRGVLAVALHSRPGGRLGVRPPFACPGSAPEELEEQVYRLYYELAMTGIEHEIAAGRVVLPRWLHIVKDADAGPDALLLPELERRLRVACREYFKDSVRLESLITGASDESPLLQLADLFAGSVARKFNKDNGAANQKDEFADFFETVAGFGFTAQEGKSDFVYVHHLA